MRFERSGVVKVDRKIEGTEYISEAPAEDNKLDPLLYIVEEKVAIKDNIKELSGTKSGVITADKLAQVAIARKVSQK